MSTKSSPPATEILVLQAFGRAKLKLAELAVETCKPLGLGPLQAGLVRRLGELKTASLAELSRLMGLDPAAIGRAVDTLIKKGWVLRIDHPSDRRRWQLSLSPKGLKLLARVQAQYAKIAAQFCGSLGAADCKALLKLLNQVEAGLDAKAPKGLTHEKG